MDHNYSRERAWSLWQIGIHRKRQTARPRIDDIFPKAASSVSENGCEFLFPLPFAGMPVFKIVNAFRY